MFEVEHQLSVRPSHTAKSRQKDLKERIHLNNFSS